MDLLSTFFADLSSSRVSSSSRARFLAPESGGDFGAGTPASVCVLSVVAAESSLDVAAAFESSLSEPAVVATLGTLLI